MKTSKEIIENLCDRFLELSRRDPGEPANASFEDWFWNEVGGWDDGNVNLISELFEIFSDLHPEQSVDFKDWLYSEVAKHERGTN